MIAATKAGFFYFLPVFALGFVFGTIRILVLTPHLGELHSVLIEAPLILLFAWVVCGWMIQRQGVPSALNARAVMGATAFSLLMIAELALSVFVFGNSIAGHFQEYATTPKLVGLAGQIVFALFPLMRKMR